MTQSIYHNIVLQYAKDPKYKVPAEELFHFTQIKNPLCGDMIGVGFVDDLQNTMQGGEVSPQLKWDGQGCLICLAAAECFCENMHNQEFPQIKIFSQTILDLFKSDNKGRFLSFENHPFEIFEDVTAIKGRIGCVTLIAKAAHKLILEIR